MTQSFDLAQAYITALTGSPETACDFRAIHDTDKSIAAHTYRGTLREIWPTLTDYNTRGYGIFMTVNALGDTIKAETGGILCEMSNVKFLRAHVVDLDNILTAQDSYTRAVAAYPQPHFAVQTSPNKYHLYWLVEPYVGNDYYTIIQRKLRQVYDGDKMVIDSSRVLRVPGFYHLKAEPYLVTCWGIHSGARWNVQAIEQSLAQVNVIDHIGMRSPLGDPEMAAPSLDWLKFALNLLDPNDLDRGEWMSISAAFKQSGWTLTDENTLLTIWNEWCAKYDENNTGENLKLWHSFRNTEVGWATFLRRTNVQGYLTHYGMKNQPPIVGVVAQSGRAQVTNTGIEVAGSNPAHPTENLPEILGPGDCKKWFDNCFFVARTGEIFGPRGRYMNSTQFNGLYGGKHFIITGAGKVTDEPWKAALRSTVYSIPKVDHTRFLPDQKPFAIIKDGMGRLGLNTYIPIIYDAEPGDVTPWLNHIEKILPNEKDRNVFYSYIAHCVKYPGHKIPWAFFLQSAEGIGKGVFIEVMKHALGSMYIYTPKAEELVNSGSKFNAWMRGRLCIIVNEIRVDEKRNLLEVLKPMITDTPIEVQAKGVDQEMEDNPANWLMFSNHKDAIPITESGRRHCIAYSALQSYEDILNAGMDDAYFNRMKTWLTKEKGLKYITQWLLDYPVPCIDDGGFPVRAPRTSSYKEALKISRSPMHIVVQDAVEDGLPGFRGDYVSSIALSKRVSMMGIKTPGANSIRSLLESMGYHEIGRANAIYAAEDLTNRAVIYAKNTGLTLANYAAAQGYGQG